MTARRSICERKNNAAKTRTRRRDARLVAGKSTFFPILLIFAIVAGFIFINLLAGAIMPAGSYPGEYIDDVEDSANNVKRLADEPGVTFVFGTCNGSGYTFTTRYSNSATTYLFTD